MNICCVGWFYIVGDGISVQVFDGIVLGLWLFAYTIAFWRLNSHNEDIVWFWCGARCPLYFCFYFFEESFSISGLFCSFIDFKLFWPGC